ncbi:MAG: PASTA domain-containing protein [Ruminococcaceae bacterium]|nr:PASTA domain-containing protein [Oscillospiraceae bacterium]
MDQYNNYIGLTLDGRYTIKRLVGFGGMAMVFEADDTFRKTVVALKILKEEFASDEISVQRFINESKAVLMLSHANIVKIFDVSVKGEHKYIVMEYIDGITLKAYIDRKGALSVKETISYTIQILRALEHAHIGGVIHRDIKPQNIMLLKNGQIKVTDFGIAKLPDAKTLTATDKAIGTVYYISPEQAAGEKGIDRRTDLYSVGVMMYEMLTGKLPFDGENPVSIALKQINEQPKAPTELQNSIPKGLEQIILFAMEKDKDKRFQTATQMIELLQKVRDNPMVIFRQKKQSDTAKKKKKSSMMPIIIGVVSAFLLVFLISGVVLINNLFFSDAATEENTVRVADYVGKSYAEIEDKIKEEFIIKRVYIASSKEEKGIILRQSPTAGEKKNSTEITLYIGEGVEEVVIENYLNKTRMEAEVDLANKGLKYDYMYEPSSTVTSGRVISTLPAAGETVTVGTTVTLILSSGEDLSSADVTTMPLLVGLSTEKAYELLVKDGLRFSAVYYEYSEEYGKGEIIEQSPVDGTIVPKGITKVSLVISKGAPPKTTSTVPEINGMTQSIAEALLKTNDLAVGSVSYEYNDDVDIGVVFGQIPSHGSVVDIGSSVSFLVSKGPQPYIPPETTSTPVTEEPSETTEETEVNIPDETTAATKPHDPISGRFN